MLVREGDIGQLPWVVEKVRRRPEPRPTSRPTQTHLPSHTIAFPSLPPQSTNATLLALRTANAHIVRARPLGVPRVQGRSRVLHPISSGALAWSGSRVERLCPASAFEPGVRARTRTRSVEPWYPEGVGSREGDAGSRWGSMRPRHFGAGCDEKRRRRVAGRFGVVGGRPRISRCVSASGGRAPARHGGVRVSHAHLYTFRRRGRQGCARRRAIAHRARIAVTRRDLKGSGPGGPSAPRRPAACRRGR